ncbi:MAG TPA: four-carbon acid sugar kinase family protein, partial [Ilumatobacteraceae bacterium]|nr:four-carbon acid sugar kinase family protein [Ilumatobacteraceae bacterium]
MNVAPALVVTADDRTGATEAAASCADAGWRVDVVPLGLTLELPTTKADCVVVDLRSRYVAPEDAQRRVTATAVAVGRNAHRVHKIDSTLRGNWPEELIALVETGRRVVLIPAHPPAGRIAVGGVVLVGDVPVAETYHAADPRRPVTTSRPSDLLPGTELAGAESLTAWLAGTERVAIVDARTMDEIERLVGVALGAPNVVIAGSASVVGAV